MRTPRRDPDEDRINKSGTKAKCRFCGEWYGLDDYHGNRSPQHIGWRIANALQGLSEDKDHVDYAVHVAEVLEREMQHKVQRVTENLASIR